MRIKLQTKHARVAVLIPSKGRPDVLLKTLRAQPFLNRPTTYIGIENAEKKAYKHVRVEFSKIRWITYDNPESSGTRGREELRKVAVADKYDRYVVTDDNTRFSKRSLKNLIAASFAYPVQPCIVAGMHGTAAHFDSGRIKKGTEVHKGFRFYKKRSAMFWILPPELYHHMSYIVDRGCMDDVQVTFAAFSLGIYAQVVCMDAPFAKKRYLPGGYGGISQRVEKVGIAIQRFAKHYPQYMEKVRVTFPWTQIEAAAKDPDNIPF